MPYTAQKSLPLTITSPPPARSLLGPGDFAYLGNFFLPGDRYGRALTHRYVGGSLRLLHLKFRGNGTLNPPGSRWALQEFSVPAFGATATQMNEWVQFWDGASQGTDGNNCHQSIWWEEPQQRLWGSLAGDYPQGSLTTVCKRALTTRTLNANGTVASYAGVWGLEGIGQRALYGKVQRVPAHFASTHNLPPYVSLSGGYSSLGAQGLGPSMGPMFVFLPDPHVYAGGAMGETGDPYDIPASACRIGADHRSSWTSPGDWFATGYASRTTDRGRRGTTTGVNWYGNDARSNPSTRPTYPTDLKATPSWWFGPSGNEGAAPLDPNGYSRWTWGDSFWDTGNWVDDDAGTLAKHGILTCATVIDGYGNYKSSALWADGKKYELHVYDPAHLAEVANGARPVWDVAPVSCLDLTPLMPGVITTAASPQFGHGSEESSSVAGMTYDPVSGRLFVLLCGDASSPARRRVYVFQVGSV